MLFRRFARRAADQPAKTLEERLFSLPPGERIYAVGDIHGRAYLLDKMLEAIARDAAASTETKICEVFLGDYVDRGAQSRAVIERLLAPSPHGHRRICLRGNHEETLLRFLNEPEILRDWASFGGYATLASYGIALPTSMTPTTPFQLRDALREAMPDAHLAFLQGLKLSHTRGDYFFVHAGIQPGVAIADQTPAACLWIREPFLSHRGYFSHYVVHGHSPVASPQLLTNRANLDVSEAKTPSLSCLVIEGNTRRILTVTDMKD